MKKFCYLLLFVCCSPTLFAQAIAEDELANSKPVWEAGAFFGTFNAPDYLASDQRQTNVLAVPYVIYRGEVLRVGDGAIARTVALQNDRYEFDLSLDASFDASASDNPARQGMPDLDYLLEIGPQLKIRLHNYRYQNGKGRLGLNLQTRAAFSTDFSDITHQGYVLHTQLTYQRSNVWGEGSLFYAAFTPAWGSEKVQDYLYQVDSQYATATRAQYNAESGYMGSELAVGLRKQLGENWRLFAGVQLGFYQGAANVNSPLFLKKNTLSGGIGVVWRFYKSERRTRVQRGL